MLARTSTTGPSPSGSPASTVSCSMTYQPSYPRASSVAHDAGDVDVALAERPVHPAGDRLGVGRVAGAAPWPAQVASTSLRWVCTTRSVASRASATGSVPPISRWPVSRHSGDAAAVEHAAAPRRTSRPSCRRAGAGGLHAPLGRPLGEPVEVVEQRASSATVVQRRALVVAVRAGRRGQHERRRHRPRRTRRVRGRPRPAGRAGVVQHDGHEAADRAQPVFGQGRRLARRVVGQEAVRPELGGAQPDLAHLGQHPLRARAGSPSPAPRRRPRRSAHRRCGPRVPSTAHRRTSSTGTGRCSRRDSSQASAM